MQRSNRAVSVLQSCLLPVICLQLFAPVASAQCIRLHPANPHYFLFRSRPTVLISSGEHYGAVLNPDFDYRMYLNSLARNGLNYTRLFTGSYFEPQGAFGIQKNTMAPSGSKVLTPWARSLMPGYAGGGNKFDLANWDEAYFRRLRDFVGEASRRGVVVEVTLFSSIYGDAQWKINPFNPANNVNSTDAIGLKSVHTRANGNIFAHQERMVRKIVRELNEFDNVIFEIQNEPWSDNHYLAGPINPNLRGWEQDWQNRVEYPTDESLDWQRAIASCIANEESQLPKRHLIAQNICNFRYPVLNIDPNISILNFHYAFPEAVSLNYGWNRAIGFDETGFAGSADDTYRKQAWSFILAGGGLFNALDYSFTVDHPEGTDSNRAPGGGSPALREQLAILKRFMEGFDFVHMRPNQEVVALAPGAFHQALSDPGKAYAIYLSGPVHGRLFLTLPRGNYEAAWTDPITGAQLKLERGFHSGGRLGLDPPAYKQDIALRVLLKKTATTVGPPARSQARGRQTRIRVRS